VRASALRRPHRVRLLQAGPSALSGLGRDLLVQDRFARTAFGSIGTPYRCPAPSGLAHAAQPFAIDTPGVAVAIVSTPSQSPVAMMAAADGLAPDRLTEIRTATYGGFALGGERFQREIAAMLGRRTWRGRPGRPRRLEGEGGQIELPV